MPIQKILVVDDSKTELMFLSDLLQKNGFVVRTAENADDAMSKLEADKPDLILMDVVMPGQNGFQLTRALARKLREAAALRNASSHPDSFNQSDALTMARLADELLPILARSASSDEFEEST